jgi:hypothetical protein
VKTFAGITAPFALIWFLDGRQEILKLGDLDRLVKEVMWTREVAAMQPYAEAQSTHIGLFRRKKIRTGFDQTRQNVMGEWDDGNMLDLETLLGPSDMHAEISARRPGPAEVNAALDGITDRLAHALDASYRFLGQGDVDQSALILDGGFSIESPENAGQTYSARSTESGLGIAEPVRTKQKVVSISAHFYTTPDDRLFLSHVSSVYTIAQRQPQEADQDDSDSSILQLAAEEAVRTADEAENDLRELIVEGLAHNMDYSQQFAHFDVKSEAKIDKETFSEGVHELGIILAPAPLLVLWDRFLKNDLRTC